MSNTSDVRCGFVDLKGNLPKRIGGLLFLIVVFVAFHMHAEEQPGAEQDQSQSYTVYVYKIVDGKRVQQNDRTLVTEDVAKAQIYFLRMKNSSGWSAELFYGVPSELPQDPPTSTTPENPLPPAKPGTPLPLLEHPPELIMLPASPLDGFPPLDMRVQVTVETVEEFVVEK